jgi:hypothetical protein
MPRVRSNTLLKNDQPIHCKKETQVMKRDDFRLLHRLRVRWAEVDMQKIVFNGHYLMYFDTAMADYWRALALPYEATMQALAAICMSRKPAWNTTPQRVMTISSRWG